MEWSILIENGKSKIYIDCDRDDKNGLMRVGDIYYRLEENGGMHSPGSMTSTDVRLIESIKNYMYFRIEESIRKEGKAPNKLEIKLLLKV
jgi:hypothetical protein